MQPFSAYLQSVSPETLVLLKPGNIFLSVSRALRIPGNGSQGHLRPAFELATHRQDQGCGQQQSVGRQNILCGFKDGH
jgi:hypothetical protein